VSVVAIVSIVSSALVAVAVTILSARLARAQQRIQASITRLDELRSVIDSAALQLRDALYEANGVWSLLDQADPTNPDPKDVYVEFGKHLNEMDDSKTRIDIRLGRSSELALQYESCRSPLLALSERFVVAIYGGGDFDAAASNGLLKEAASERDRFLDAASRLLAPDVTLAATSVRPQIADDRSSI
jgi:hypothetical protein